MKRITMFFLLVVMSTSARSAIIDSGTFFTDTESGLDWLKWESMSGRSYDYVTDNMDIGEEFYGWSYGGDGTYLHLLCNVFNVNSCDFHQFNYEIPENYNYGGVIEDLFGGSGVAVTGDINNTGPGCYPNACQQGLSIGFYGIYGPQTQTGIPRSQNTGHLLVRPATIPIPATAWLFGSALAGLLVARRNK